MIVWCGNLTILLSGLTFHCFWYRKQKTLCDSFRRPSRSDFVQSEFVALLKQANTDSSHMAEIIGVSEAQLRFVTNTSSGMGLMKCDNPFR